MFRHYLHRILADPVSFLTLILAGSTLGLWLSTRRLWQGTEAQGEKLTTSIEANVKLADAMEKRARVADLAAYHSLRAYIAVSCVDLIDFEPGKEPMFRISIINQGGTPAWNVRPYMSVNSGSTDVSREFVKEQQDTAPLHASSGYVIAPHVDHRVVVMMPKPDAVLIQSVIDRNSCIFLVGRIAYDTIGQVGSDEQFATSERTTWFAFHFNGMKVLGRDVIFFKYGNHAD